MLDTGPLALLARPRCLENRAMKVGLIASPWVPVPPPGYGGTEAVIDVLARGLQDQGDDVLLVATGDSTCRVPRTWSCERALGTAAMTVAAEARHVVHAYEALAGCDVIHDHTLLGPLYAASVTDTPVVTTSHGPFTDELRLTYASIAARVAVVAISHHQRSSAPEVDVSTVIHHGMEVDAVPFGQGDGGYAVFLGRMSADKGADRAIRVARAAGVPLLLAAKMREPEEQRYFHDVVEPLLSEDAVYIGEVGGVAKQQLLGNAVALINPIRWPEPFGLVMIEALATGTPVIAFPEGAAPEIVDHGVTGFLCTDEDDMACSLSRVSEIRRPTCRSAAALRFSADRMVADHRALYRSLVSDQQPAQVIDLITPLARREQEIRLLRAGSSR
jgi:glycosyltransferase involved in cell wall biosynthesis